MTIQAQRRPSNGRADGNTLATYAPDADCRLKFMVLGIAEV